VLIAGACGAAAAAVSMMAGAYLDEETTRDEANVTRSALAPVYKVHRVGVCG
jgi:vacuolar iron transporter family protein